MSVFTQGLCKIKSIHVADGSEKNMFKFVLDDV